MVFLGIMRQNLLWVLCKLFYSLKTCNWIKKNYDCFFDVVCCWLVKFKFSNEAPNLLKLNSNQIRKRCCLCSLFRIHGCQHKLFWHSVYVKSVPHCASIYDSFALPCNKNDDNVRGSKYSLVQLKSYGFSWNNAAKFIVGSL